ncbi:MAG: hypothetical protein HW373_298 [Deltaproteobacteria bacterium]|nr:hypothetical protein [Deltaproteobacteria bacterium]
MEWIKDLTDRLLLWFLRATSSFGSELTQDGKSEQALWREQRLRNREQRLRNLQALSHRSRQRFGGKS